MGRTLWSVPDCLALHTRDHSKCGGTPETWSSSDPLYDAARELQLPGITTMETQRYLCTAASDVMQVLFVTSLFAAVLSFHNVLSRYFFSLGNTGVLPGICGRSHARHASPHVASLVTTLSQGAQPA